MLECCCKLIMGLKMTPGVSFGPISFQFPPKFGADSFNTHQRTDTCKEIFMVHVGLDVDNGHHWRAILILRWCRNVNIQSHNCKLRKKIQFCVTSLISSPAAALLAAAGSSESWDGHGSWGSAPSNTPLLKAWFIIPTAQSRPLGGGIGPILRR